MAGMKRLLAETDTVVASDDLGKHQGVMQECEPNVCLYGNAEGSYGCPKEYQPRGVQLGDGRLAVLLRTEDNMENKYGHAPQEIKIGYLGLEI